MRPDSSALFSTRYQLFRHFVRGACGSDQERKAIRAAVWVEETQTAGGCLGGVDKSGKRQIENKQRRILEKTKATPWPVGTRLSGLTENVAVAILVSWKTRGKRCYGGHLVAT